MTAAARRETPAETRPSGARAARRPLAAPAAAMACAGVLAACGSVAAPGTAAAARPVTLPLATTLAGRQVSWAAVPMGTAAAGPEQFWELFARPAAGTRWVLATPPDAATNGAIALAVPAGGQAVTAGIRPSQNLRFSPVTATASGGQSWSPGSPAAGLARVPDALAAAPAAAAAGSVAPAGGAAAGGAPAGGAAAGQLIALSAGGAVTEAAGPDASWTALTSARAVAATPAARACGVRQLTAVAFSPAGAPVLGAACTRPGVAGILTGQGGTWQAAAVTVPAALSRRPLTVLALDRAGSRLTALLQAGAGRGAVLLAAWTTGGAWTVSAVLAGSATSASFGADGTPAVTLAGGRAAVLAPAPAPGASAAVPPGWRSLPRLPAAPHVTLALLAGGTVQALATSNTVLTVWQLSAAGTWSAVQQTTVPIQSGSST